MWRAPARWATIRSTGWFRAITRCFTSPIEVRNMLPSTRSTTASSSARSAWATVLRLWRFPPMAFCCLLAIRAPGTWPWRARLQTRCSRSCLRAAARTPSQSKPSACDRPDLRALPAAGCAPRNKEQRRSRGQQNQHLRPQRTDRQVAPEDLCESVNCPGVDGEQSCLLHGRRHQIAREHAAADGRHHENKQRRDRAELRTRAAHRSQQNAEGRHSNCGAEPHYEEAGNVREEIHLERRPRPHEHHDQLRKGEQRVVEELAAEQRAHGNARAEHAIERTALGLVEERARR